MAVGFFAGATREGFATARFESSFVADTLWDKDGVERKIDLRGRNWQVVCLGDGGKGCCQLWREEEQPEFAGSFVYVLGWCYRISSRSPQLGAEDYREILNRVRQGAAPITEDYSGHFVLVAFDAKRNRVVVQPDRLAVVGAFHATGDGEVAVSNRALRVASFCQSAIDGHSLLSVMRGTHIPFGRTLFSDVQRLMCGCYLEIDLDAARAQVKKPPSIYVPTRQISYAGAVELYSETVKTTVKRLLGAPVWFDLTGGNDTRVLASGVENLTRSNGTRNYAFRVADPEGSPDVRVARQVAAACGWPLFRMDRYLSQEAPPEQLLLAAASGDGNFTLNGCWERIQEERSYSGLGQWKTHVGAAAGEIFRGFFYAHEMLNLGRTSEVNYEALLKYRTYASQGVNLALFGNLAPALAQHDEVLMAPYREIGAAGESRANTYKLDQMYVQRHCYRTGNAVSWIMGFSNVRLPFLSWELGGMGLSLPWKYRANRGLVQRVIGRLSPKLAEIPNEDGEPMKPVSLSTLPAYMSAKIPIAFHRAARVAREFMGESAGAGQNAFPLPHAGYFALLENARFLPGVFDTSAVNRTAAEARSEQRSRDALVTFYALCTVEALLQQVPGLRRRVVFA